MKYRAKGIGLLVGLALAVGVGLGGAVKAQGYPNQVTDLAWSPDGRQIALSTLSGVVEIVDAVTGQVTVSKQVAETSISGIAWHPEGERIAIGDVAGYISVWDVMMNPLLDIRAGGAVYDVAWSADGAALVAACETALPQYLVKVWDAQTGASVRILGGHSDGVYAVDWSPNGGRVISGGADGLGVIWDSEDETLAPLVLAGHTFTVEAVAWNHDGTLVATGAGLLDSTVRIWDASTGQCLIVIPVALVDVIAWHPTRNLLATAGGQTIQVFETGTGQVLLVRQETASIDALAWSPDGCQIAYHDAAHGLTVIDVSAAAVLVPTVTEAAPRPRGPIDQPIAQAEVGEAIFQVAWHPHADILAVASTQGLTLFNDTLQPLNGLYPDEHVSSVTWSPDGDRIAIAHANHVEVWAWDASSHRLTQETTFEEGGHYRQVAWSPDGAWIAAFRVIDPYDGYGTYIVWDAMARTLQSESPPYAYYPEGIGSDVFDWGPNGVPLLLGAGYGVADGTEEATSALIAYTIQAETGERVQTLPIDGSGPYVLAVAWHPAGNLFAVGGVVSAEVYSLVTGVSVVSIPISVGVSTLDWTPDGRYLVGNDGVADFQNDAMLGAFHSRGPVSDAKWNHDGTLLAIAAYGAVRIEDPNLLPGFARPTQTRPCACDL